MNKKLLLVGVIGTLVSTNVKANELRQYISLKTTYSDMNNKYKETFTEKDNKYTYKWINESDLDDTVWGGSLAYGIKYGSLRGELEANLHQDLNRTYESHTIDEDSYSAKATLKNKSLMLNAYYDIETGTKFTPFIGGGVGYSRLKVEADAINYSKSFNQFAWQIGAGVSYAVTDKANIDFGYRYVDYGKITLGHNKIKEDMWFGTEKDSLDMYSNEFYLGVRYNF